MEATYSRKLVDFSTDSRKHVRQIADPQLIQIISCLKCMWDKFIAAQSMLEKLSALEEAYFYTELEFSLMGKEKDSSLKDYIVKLSMSKLDDLFRFYVHFKMAHDFYIDSNSEFIDPEFLHSLEIIVQSLIN